MQLGAWEERRLGAEWMDAWVQDWAVWTGILAVVDGDVLGRGGGKLNVGRDVERSSHKCYKAVLR